MTTYDELTEDISVIASRCGQPEDVVRRVLKWQGLIIRANFDDDGIFVVDENAVFAEDGDRLAEWVADHLEEYVEGVEPPEEFGRRGMVVILDDIVATTSELMDLPEADTEQIIAACWSVLLPPSEPERWPALKFLFSPIQRERDFEDALVGRLEVLADHGYEVELYSEGSRRRGRQYQAGPTGRMDLLCRYLDGSGWLVIENKAWPGGRSAYEQTRRYMGWVRANLAAESEVVHGLILCEGSTQALRDLCASDPDVDYLPIQRLSLWDADEPRP